MSSRQGPVVLPEMVESVSQMWHVLLDLAEALPQGWTLVGGQMVLLHALEAGVSPARPTQDGDVVANVRSDPAAVRKVVAALGEAGLALEGVSAMGIGHRYVRALTGASRASQQDRVVVDVLAPEGLGPKADLETTKPGRTIEAPGGTQALNRSELVVVRHRDRVGSVPRPSLLGAVVGKAAACALPGDVSRHYTDLALLLALVEDPFDMVEQCERKDLQRLRATKPLSDPLHAAWRLLPTELAQDGQRAHQILTS